MSRLLPALLGLWVVLAVIGGGLLLAPHLVALPMPTKADTALRDAIAARLRTATWGAVHVMYRSCACSRRTVAHLTSRRRSADLQELVFMVDDAGEAGPTTRRELGARGRRLH